MFRSIFPILLSSALANTTFALSEPGEAAKQELHAAIKTEDESRAKPGASGSGRSGLAYIRNLDETTKQGNKQQIEYSLNQIAENYRSPAVSQALEKFQTALNLEAKELEEAELARIDSLLTEVGEVIRKAAKPKDLDAILDKMDKLGESRSERRSEKLSAAYQAMRPTRQFAASWQDYLQALASGSRNKANQILRNLTSTNTSIPVPRSLVIALIDESASPSAGAGAMPQEIKELDQMAPVLRHLRAMAMTDRANSSTPDPLGTEWSILALAPLDKAYQDFKAGLPVNLDLILQQGDPQTITGASAIAGLKAKLLLLLLPRHLGLSQAATPKPGETVAQFLDRTEKEAGERGDDTTCIRVIETRLALKSTSPITPGLAAFRAGKAREAAGQPLLAAFSYHAALKSETSLTLAALIGRRLDEIERTHPEEYKQALERIMAQESGPR